jgi:hypothetical protein
LPTFIDSLQERNYEEEVREFLNDMRPKMRYRLFEPIRITDNLWLSIQASYAHYSTPSETLYNLKEYTHWEIAIYNENDFVSMFEVLPEFHLINVLQNLFEGSVYPYVPTVLVEEVYLALMEY